jgi:hypothetical protein
VDRPVELIPLLCLKCQTPVPAQPEEVAWACARCGQGLILDEAKGLALLEIQYDAGLARRSAEAQQSKGRPFWVADGLVVVERQTYSGNKGNEAQRFWSEPHRFFVPAYTCPLETLLDMGPQMLLKPPALQPLPTLPPGEVVSRPYIDFAPVTLLRSDVQALAEFIVVAIEAGRSDMLKQLQVKVQLAEPVLWILA